MIRVLQPARLRQLEVRCAADLLLGWVIIDASGPVRLSPGGRVTFPLRGLPARVGDPFYDGVEQLDLHFDDRFDQFGVKHLVLRAADVPLEQLSRVDGFFTAH